MPAAFAASVPAAFPRQLRFFLRGFLCGGIPRCMPAASPSGFLAACPRHPPQNVKCEESAGGRNEGPHIWRLRLVEPSLKWAPNGVAAAPYFRVYMNRIITYARYLTMDASEKMPEGIGYPTSWRHPDLDQIWYWGNKFGPTSKLLLQILAMWSKYGFGQNIKDLGQKKDIWYIFGHLVHPKQKGARKAKGTCFGHICT